MTDGTSQRSEVQPLDLGQRIDAVCDRFETLCRAGQHPSIASFLQGTQGNERAQLLRELIALDVDFRRRRGAQPIVDDYTARFPDDQKAIEDAFAEIGDVTIGIGVSRTFQLGSIPRHPTAGARDLDRIEHYQVGELIGTGATGLVYRAIDTRTQQPVAVKVLSPEASAQEYMQRRFIREMTAMSKLNHRNVVRYLDCGLHDNQFFCVMELVDFNTMRGALRQRKRFAWQAAVEYGIQICDALDHIHTHGIIHRDLKPANLFLSAEGLVKLGDFGLARDNNELTVTLDGQTMGTCLYMAPEQITGEHVIAAQTDLYALGCLFCKMLTGHAPFNGNSLVDVMEQHLSAAPPEVHDRLPDCPPALAELTGRLLEKVPANRPPDAGAVRARLVAARSDEAAPAG